MKLKTAFLIIFLISFIVLITFIIPLFNYIVTYNPLYSFMNLNDAIVLEIILFLLAIGSVIGIILISRAIYQLQIKNKKNNKKKILYKKKIR